VLGATGKWGSGSNFGGGGGAGSAGLTMQIPLPQNNSGAATVLAGTPLFSHNGGGAASFLARQRSGMTLATAPAVGGGGGGGAPSGVPLTPAGAALLEQTLQRVSLPPEEWADEVKDAHGR